MQKPRTRKPAEARKSEIIDVAIRLSASLGPDRLTTDKLAREIGISQAAIFRHFPTKNDIWLAVGHRITSTMKMDTALGAEPAKRPVDQLREMVFRQLSFIEKTPAVPAILFSRELHAENDDLRQLFVAIMKNRQTIFASLVEQEKAAGGFDDSLNAPDAATAILALIQGVAMRWSLNARCFDLVKEGRRMLELLIRGMGN